MSNVTKQGLMTSSTLEEYIEYEDATWILICVLDVKNGSNLFTSGSVEEGYVYKNELCWCDFKLIDTETRPESELYEFLTILEEDTNRVINKYRWKQNKSPFVATWNDVNPSKIGSGVTRISSSITSSYAGMYISRGTRYMIFANGTNGNTFGCGCSALWGGTAGTDGYIPGYNGKKVYGLQLLYMRVINPISKLYNNVVISNNLIEY